MGWNGLLYDYDYYYYMDYYMENLFLRASETQFPIYINRFYMIL